MDTASSGEFTAVSLTITQALVLWTSYGPKFEEVRNTDQNDKDFTEKLRHAELMVGGITIGVGVVSSILLKSPLPLIAGIATVGALSLAYETSLRYDGFSG